MFYVHKYEVAQQYGGPEEGGWWFNLYTPEVSNIADFDYEEDAYDLCRALNRRERRRRETLAYGYISVLSHREMFYSYDVTESPVAERIPAERPHYE
jgi:hypothetical protein